MTHSLVFSEKSNYNLCFSRPRIVVTTSVDHYMRADFIIWCSNLYSFNGCSWYVSNQKSAQGRQNWFWKRIHLQKKSRRGVIIYMSYCTTKPNVIKRFPKKNYKWKNVRRGNWQWMFPLTRVYYLTPNLLNSQYNVSLWLIFF